MYLLYIERGGRRQMGGGEREREGERAHNQFFL